MVPGHQFQAYLTLSKSCIYARNLHLEPPHTWKKQPRKKSLPNATKRLEINTPSKGICKGKNHQQKQEFTKATKTLQINTLLKGIWKGKSTYSITFNYRFICVYPTIYIYIFWWCPASVSCVPHTHHAYMHEIIHLEPPPYLEKATKKKESTKSYKTAWNQYSFWGNLQRKNPPAKTKIHQSYKNASNQYFLKRNLERKKQVQYNIQP